MLQPAERGGVRRLWAVVLAVVFGIPLLAATPNAFYLKPNVIVYPFTATGSSLDREASSRLATILATQMASTGKVKVIPPPPGTERKDYLTVARTQKADYYVTGYITPLGSGVSLVQQVVSTATGIVVFSQSAQVNTYAEAAGQGDDLASFIASHANRGLAAIPTSPPRAASPTPGPSSGPEANLGKLFGRRKRPASTPAPTATPKPAATTGAAANVTTAAVPATATPTARPRSVAAATAHYAILPVEGTADAALREFAAQRLIAKTNGELAASRAAACAAGTPHAVLSSSLAVRTDAQFGGGSATFELTATNCAGIVLWHQTHGNDAGGAQGLQLATERAVDAAIGAYLNPPKRRRR